MSDSSDTYWYGLPTIELTYKRTLSSYKGSDWFLFLADLPMTGFMSDNEPINNSCMYM